MAGFSVAMPHRLQSADALNRLREMVQRMRHQPEAPLGNFQERWSGLEGWISFETHGMSISGHLTVSESRVVIDGDAPWIAVGQVKSMISDLVAEALRAPAQPTPRRSAPTAPRPHPQTTAATPPMAVKPVPTQPSQSSAVVPSKPVQPEPPPATEVPATPRPVPSKATPSAPYRPADPMPEGGLHVPDPIRFLENLFNDLFD